MELKEYIAMQTIGTVFANYGLPEDYGFKTHYDVYERLVQNEAPLVMFAGTEDEEELYVCEAYEHSYVPYAVEETYVYIEYLIKGLKEYKVEV